MYGTEPIPEHGRIDELLRSVDRPGDYCVGARIFTPMPRVMESLLACAPNAEGRGSADGRVVRARARAGGSAKSLSARPLSVA